MEKGKIFAFRLRELMNQGAKTSQGELASAIGITRQAISKYMTSSTLPDCQTLVKIAQYFNVSTDFLLGLSDTRSPDDVKMLGLKPCPFCGEVPDTVITGLIAYPGPFGESRPRNIAVKVTCNNCKISFASEIEADEGFFSYSFANVFQAVCETEELWNKRSDA